MAVMRIIFFLFLNVLYVRSYVDDPVPSWSDPMIKKHGSLRSTLEHIPKTTDAVLPKGWTLRDLGHPNKVKAYCPKLDGTLCTLHDKNDRIVGVMLAIPKDDPRTVTSPYRYSGSPWFSLKKISGQNYYTMDIYFVSQDHLDDPGRGAPFDSIGETFRIMKSDGRQSMEVPSEESELAAAGWTKQNCEPNVGTHYLYKLGKDCKDLLPIVMLVKNEDVVGFSFIIPSSYQSPYFEKTTPKKIKSRFPYAPACLSDWAKNYKISSLYMTFAPVKDLKKCEKSDHAKPRK